MMPDVVRFHCKALSEANRRYEKRGGVQEPRPCACVDGRLFAPTAWRFTPGGWGGLVRGRSDTHWSDTRVATRVRRTATRPPPCGLPCGVTCRFALTRTVAI